MKKREAAIITAYTGVLIGEFRWPHEYAKQLIGGEAMHTICLTDSFFEKLKEMSATDFKMLLNNIDNTIDKN